MKQERESRGSNSHSHANSCAVSSSWTYSSFHKSLRVFPFVSNGDDAVTVEIHSGQTQNFNATDVDTGLCYIEVCKILEK